MKNNIKSKKRTKQTILMKRITSIATAAVMLSVSLPMSEIKDGCGVLSSFIHTITANAFDGSNSNPVSISSFQQLIDYSNNYDSTHANDTITITFGDSDTSGELTGFTSIGTVDAPFDGKIVIGSGMTLNLPTTMFSYITDDVQIVDTSGVAATLVLTRTRVTQDEPLFAENVVHNSSSTGANWSIHCDRYYNPDNKSRYAYSFAGFIGTMKTGAKVNFKSLVFDNLGGNGTANISATGDSGLVCRTMEANAILEVDGITQTSMNSSSAFNIESTSSGNVGGLVGTMNDSSKLILGTGLANIQGSNQEIKATSGYAGGIVGSCNGGTIEFNNTTTYSPTQIITGSTGSGGIAGYYNTAVTGTMATDTNRYAISTKKVSITSSCKVNGDGDCGGLFGVVYNDGDMTITGSIAVSPAHGAGAADSFGGLIGKYTAVALSDFLTVNTTGNNAPIRNGGSASQFGGMIGEVSGASYVKFSGVSVKTTGASATTNFGGVVGKAASGFIELAGTNTIGYDGVSTTKTFGGVVGDFANGVIYLQDSTDLSDTSTVSDAAASSGQIAGYREYGLVFAADGWELTRSNNAQTLDDVGSWGEVVRFDDDGIKQSDVLTVTNTSGSDHYVTLSAAVTSMETTPDFVKTALNIQLNKGQSTGVLRCSGDTSTALLGSSSSLSLKSSAVSIELDGTGITGLTRDNGTDCVTFSGTFDGNGGKIKLATGEDYFEGSNTEGNGKIYRHVYNGLFAMTSGATIQNLNIASDSAVKVNALDEMYIGNVIAQASGDLTLDTVKVCNDGKTTPVDYATIDAAGSSINIGGLVGNLTSAGAVSITGCEYQGEVKGDATDSKIGGLIGSVSDSDTFDITISGTTKVGGKITAASGNEVGGTIGVIDSSTSDSSGRTLTLNGLTVSGLIMTVSDTCGGFLGQNWYKTDVEFTSVNIGSGAALTSSGDTAGLVHTATGYWKVNGGGITLGSSTSGDTMSVTSSGADFGLLVNKGYADDSAIYLELAPSAFTLTKAAVTLSLSSVTVFDELVAYTGSGSDVLGNGKGVVSIATDGNTLLKMGSSGTGASYTGTTYQHKTAFLDSNTGLIDNPHSRYYYNLDSYRSNPAAGAQQLLIWSVRQYAHESIQDYFNFTGTSIGTNASTSLDMVGYSYYPVDLTGTLTLNGAVHLYNTEFDTTEHSTTDKRETTDEAQHYLMQNGLFRNVSGTLTFNGSLNGNINKIGNYCGALAMGTVSTDASGTPATINVNGLVLAGINIGSNAGPLIINKAGSNATLNITNVSNDNTSYTNMGAGAGATKNADTGEYTYSPSYIATSLLGEIGSANASAVKLTFSLIKLDGRKDVGVTELTDLDSVYNSKGSLFSDATLVKTFAYKSNSGSYGVYNYEYDKDWNDGNGNIPRNVTYGAEIDNTVENTDDAGHSKQQKYNRLSENDTIYYTRPDEDPATNTNAVYDHFGDYFLNYVGSAYTSGGTNHELRVNISTASFSGCGTYNDPYIITSGGDLENIAKLINNTFTDTSFTIRVPSAITDSNKSATWCANKEDHIAYTTFNKPTGSESSEWTWSTGGDNPTTILNDTLREYLAGAYYKVDSDITGNITLTTDFEGLSNNVGGAYAFRGVIDGSGKTIVNPTTQSLIVNSYGSVVYNLELDVQPSTPQKLSMTAAKSFLETGTLNSERCETYGAVMGQIFGGDNIIDDVSVKFTGTIIDANGKSKAYLVPIGGYVGVVINGGLIFREMTGLVKDNQAGLKAANLTNFASGVGKTPANPLASDNTKWLYVNPIVGRVLNGYVITESASYKPFEDGTRTYPDGTVETWSGGAVTMRNGTKNYSIADISTSDTGSFVMSGITTNSNITISSAQALHIMSLITECGMGKSSTGSYSQTSTNGATTNNGTTNFLTPYDSYMATHDAGYHYVGDSSLSSGAAPTVVTENKSAAQTDYVSSTNDCYAGITGKVPYIIKHYTNSITNNSTTIYPAFDVAGDSSHYYNLILAESDDTYALPDSYRGLGSLMFGVAPKTADNKDYNLDSFKEHVVFLYSLNGNDNTISTNMNLQFYGDDYYTTLNGPQGYFKNGFGFINALQSSYNNNSARKFKNLTLEGSVYYQLIDSSTGKHTDYNSTYVQKLFNPAVSAFVGSPVAESGDAYFENITLDSMSITGMRYAGGYLGALNIGAKCYFDNCNADDLQLFAGGAAGSLIGYMRNGSAKIYVNDGTFGIISIISASTATDLGNQSNAAAGGLIGDRQSGVTTSNAQNFFLDNVTIKNGTSVPNGGYIGYYNDGLTSNSKSNPSVVSAGGIIGRGARTTILSADNVNVINMNICGAYAGGMIGSLTGNYSYVEFNDSHVITDTDEKCYIESKYNNTAAGSGGFIGKYTQESNAPASSTFDICSLEGYTVSGYQNVGGLIGSNSNSKTPKIIANNITISDHMLKCDEKAGGLIGYQQYGELNGYNILIKNQTTEEYSETAINNNGYIIGYNNDKDIKLIGFSRQGTIDTAKMVGNKTATASDRYGTDGYVIFADYSGAQTNQSASGISNTNNIASDDESPYVTINPNFAITSTQFLTGDGVSNTSYYGSAAQAIVQGINTNKGYVNTGMTDAQRTALRTRLASNMSSIKSVVTSSGSYSGVDFPVLIIDDLSTANDLVNNYLKLLTNTNYDFYDGYSNDTTYTGDDKAIYNVDISKWKFDSPSGTFIKQSGSASLKCDVNDRFYITPTEVDNENWQFSLIDVQFYDPSTVPTFNANNTLKKAGAIAYHLYVPVVVKKMLHYTVQIRQASTTNYNLNAYPSSVANLVENLGNPVTFKVTYTYQQTAKNWKDAINGGESVYRNYNKILDLKSWGDLFPADALVVLVDPNNNADKYYSDYFKAQVTVGGEVQGVFTNGEVIDEGTKTYELNLNSFNDFTLTKINDLMTISLDTEAEAKNLCAWVEGTDAESSIVAVVNDGGDNNGLKLRYKKTGETGAYAVNVTLKEHQNNGEYAQENYYISVFTKENASDTNIYHYQISSSGTSFGDSSYPSARVGTPETPHLFLGNIYTNNVGISETNPNQLMSESNLYLSADLTASVGFTANAVDSSIASFINNDNVKIYQTFMTSLNKLNGDSNQRGILVDPSIEPTNYKINNAEPDTPYDLDYNISSSYIELTNNCNIKSYLQYAANHPKTETVDGVTKKDYTISITESVKMTYVPSSLSTQFPQATASTATNTSQSSVGTYMIGYSNISSTSDGGAASRASANTDDDSARLCYYIADDTSVDFSYNAVYNSAFDGDGNGNYGQLGLDGKEMDENGNEYVQIKSAARYDTHDYNLKSSGKYVKITVSLTKKGESGNKAPYSTPLYIPTYLDDFKILDGDDHEIVAVTDDPATDADETVIVIKNSADNIYTYIVPKEMLGTLSEDEFYIPINFKVYSGNNETFEDMNFGDDPKDMQYSNYKVNVTVGLLKTHSTTEAMLTNSDGEDHIIYTNAKIHSEVID